MRLAARSSIPPSLVGGGGVGVSIVVGGGGGVDDVAAVVVRVCCPCGADSQPFFSFATTISSRAPDAPPTPFVSLFVFISLPTRHLPDVHPVAKLHGALVPAHAGRQR